MNETADFQESTKKDKQNKIYEFDDLLRLTGGFGPLSGRFIRLPLSDLHSYRSTTSDSGLLRCLAAFLMCFRA